jgi:phospholipase/carboxylesterase
MSLLALNIQGPHRDRPVLTLGSQLAQAKSAMIMLHGRGANAQDILELANEFNQPNVIYIAPSAANDTWYPNSFLAPLASNEPWLSSALSVVGSLLSQIQAAGIPAERTILLGFSQGACLALEFVARNAQRYGGVAGLSGGLIGPDGTPHNYAGSLANTPIFLGCSDRDFHIPKARVQLSAEILRGLGGDVTMKLYPNMGHTVNQDEIDHVENILTALAPTTR